jgi:hypothetical protein
MDGLPVNQDLWLVRYRISLSMKLRIAAVTVVAFCLLPLVAIPAGACSLAGCLDRGIEMRPDFVVKIRHAK